MLLAEDRRIAEIDSSSSIKLYNVSVSITHVASEDVPNLPINAGSGAHDVYALSAHTFVHDHTSLAVRKVFHCTSNDHCQAVNPR